MTTLLSSEAMSAPAEQSTAPAASQTFKQTLHNIFIVTDREVRDSFRDWRIMAPIFILTLVFPILAQQMTGLFVHFFESNGASSETLVNSFLPLMPMIVGFFPISISLVIALETFVGEKERRSLEPLLSTPLTNTELYVGKALAAMIPPLLASYTGIGIYVGGMIFGTQHWRPEPELVIQIMVLTTAQALIMVTGAVVVSSQTTSTRASNLLASFIIIPISMLVMLESFIMVTNNRYVLWYIVGGLFVADVMLFGMGARLFNREELLGRAIDEVNLKWAWNTFAREFKGDDRVKGIITWYRYSVLSVFPKLRIPALIVVVCIVGTMVGGALISIVRPDFQIPTNVTNQAQLINNFRSYLNLSNSSSVIAILTQNIRVLLAATILATFTFGVMGIAIGMASYGGLGFLFGQPVVGKLGLTTIFLAALLPHSLIEIPASVIALAAALRLGAIVTRPPAGKGVWDSWLAALADVVKMWIGVVLPLLIVAAVIEVYVTPQIVLLVSR